MFDEALLRRYLYAALKELLKAKPGTTVGIGERSGRFILEGKARSTHEGASIRIGLSVASIAKQQKDDK